MNRGRGARRSGLDLERELGHIVKALRGIGRDCPRECRREPGGKIRPPRRNRPKDLSALRPDLPAWLEAALTRAVALDPAKRFDDMIEFALVLEAGPARSPAAIRQPRTLYERAPLQFWQGVAALLALALLASWLAR